MLRLYPGFVEQPRGAVENDPRATETWKTRGIWKPGQVQRHDVKADSTREDDGLNVGASIESSITLSR